MYLTVKSKKKREKISYRSTTITNILQILQNQIIFHRTINLSLIYAKDFSLLTLF